MYGYYMQLMDKIRPTVHYFDSVVKTALVQRWYNKRLLLFISLEVVKAILKKHKVDDKSKTTTHKNIYIALWMLSRAIFNHYFSSCD